MENNQDPWKFFKEIDFTDESILKYNVDTRDFHVSCMKEEEIDSVLDISKIEKYPDRFFHTTDEIISLVERYYFESGRDAKWRFFSLEGMSNWSMKYIRIHRTPLGLVVCNSDNRAIRKDVLVSNVSQEFLNSH